MATIKETLEMCKVVIDGLAVGADISVQRSSMVELSNHIAIALEDERLLTPRALDGLTETQKFEVAQMINNALLTGSA